MIAPRYVRTPYLPLLWLLVAKSQYKTADHLRHLPRNSPNALILAFVRCVRCSWRASLEDEGTVERLRLGRENVVELAESMGK